MAWGLGYRLWGDIIQKITWLLGNHYSMRLHSFALKKKKNLFGVKDICSEKVHLLKFKTLKQNITRCLTFLCGTNISIPVHSDSLTGLTIICSTLKKVSLYLTFPFNRNKYLQMLSNFIWLILKMFLCYCALYYVLFYIG